MFFTAKDLRTFEPTPGFLLRSVSGRNAMLCHVVMEPNSRTKLESHADEEEMGFMLDGEFEMTLGDETKVLRKGDIFLVPPKTKHGGVARTTGASMISIFSPPRRAYK